MRSLSIEHNGNADEKRDSCRSEQESVDDGHDDGVRMIRDNTIDHPVQENRGPVDAILDKDELKAIRRKTTMSQGRSMIILQVVVPRLSPFISSHMIITLFFRLAHVTEAFIRIGSWRHR